MPSTARFGDDQLWAITSYFNPMCYTRRLLNFRTFRKNLNIPLLVIELSYRDDFELAKDDAEILIQLRGGAILWQKERLLNLALEALPSHCHKVVWLDCDILFGQSEWAFSASHLLDDFAIVQMFKNAHYLTPHWTPDKDHTTEIEFSRPSAVFSISAGASPTVSIGHSLDQREGTPATGFAWAARRELIQRHGFYDACILGGGDRAMVCAAYGVFEEFMSRHYMNTHQREKYFAWARSFYEAVDKNITYLDTDIFHLWHGDVRQRRTRSRHQGLQQFGFDPFTDIALNQNGCWRWSTEKKEMHDYIHEYFSSRTEDG